MKQFFVLARKTGRELGKVEDGSTAEARERLQGKRVEEQRGRVEEQRGRVESHTLQKPKLAAPSATTRKPRSDHPARRVSRRAWKRQEDKILKGWRGHPPGFLRGPAGALLGGPRMRGGKTGGLVEGGRGGWPQGSTRPSPPLQLRPPA